MSEAGLPQIDVNEYGGKKDGERQQLDRRLFMQLLVFDVPTPSSTDDVARSLAKLVQARGLPAVIYADTASPRGLGLLTWSEEPAHFVKNVRPLFATDPLCHVIPRDSFSMMGRTYSNGYEPDLAFTLLERPIRNVMAPESPWHVWYPLRRIGAFNRVEPQEVSAMMREHATIGHAYGQQELAHDVRLACHGVDASDNEFVIGLIGHDLHRLSHLVQSMRKTRQTSEYMEKMGPFFVGYVLDRS